MKNILELKNIGKKYQAKNGEIEALKNVNLKVQEGEFVSIIGPSGCGKSTLLSIIAGLEKQTSGEVLKKGEIGYMLQTDSLLPWRQRVALIRTLATRPSILLLDEAFSALDYQTRIMVTNDIFQILKNEKITAVMVTHDISEAISMSDRVVVLTNRPGTVNKIHEIDFEMENRNPINCRESPKFSKYFDTIWKELDVHV